MEQVTFLIGGNLGDRFSAISEAKALLLEKFTLDKQSSIYETAAWGGVAQQGFLNQALCMWTPLNPMDTLAFAQQVETQLGRQRDIKWGDRTMDIDIIFFGKQLIQEPDLVVPHPYMRERKFVLAPLAEIMPDFIHPLYKKSIQDLLEECKDLGKVEKWRE
ncbi:2-amino-4-hydroxy-6-hydroxymethyldihydropteridine diphosphokinase [Echinicola pacifica]|uniref:2-amino-4-hydroxy-6-hydroxymethyldihydropteridine pyrophosphokinase n=1 Tax=Echinicola pacifica TaxID=346377 RepID=A0A918PMN1_9BACT|nr:2-amino-4-hydroxy-6-hydroxymethyldihydropteridine diphosphokinase [Echinicola pacifica]GGZ14090.1 2-amino-4-hydroxy-6-hydroxymethyldihydropteridine diphosphokinase [Echinicola pacifica]